MQDTTFPTFKGLAQDLQFWESVKLSPYPNVTLYNGETGIRSTVRFRTAEDPERMRGPNLSGIWLDEASLMEKDAYLICIACLRESGRQGWLSATFTGKGLMHWTYEIFGKNAPDTAIFHSHTRDNPFNPVGFAETLGKQYSGLRARQELGGEFVAVEGAEWPAEYFPESIWFDDWPDLNWRARVMGLDPAKGRSAKPGCYSTWVEMAVDDKLCLWVDADMDQQRPVEISPSNPHLPSIVGDGVRLIRSWKPSAVVVETNGFQEMVATALHRELMAQNILVALFTICNSQPKPSRIRTLGAYLAGKRLRIRRSNGGEILMGQLRDFPVAEHDDGPDAVKLAEVLADYLLTGNREGPGRPHILRP